MAAAFLPTYLKLEMLHVYRQISALQSYCPWVLTHKPENVEQFPIKNLTEIPKASTRELRRFWCRRIKKQSIQIYRREATHLESILERGNASLLHIYFGQNAVYLLPWLNVRRRAAVASFHGADAAVGLSEPSAASAMREMFALPDLVLVRSAELQSTIESAGCDPAKIRLHRAGLPLEEFPFQKRNLPANNEIHLLQACRLIPKKGLDVTVKAFARFSSDFPPARLTIAGDGPQLDSLKALAHTLGIENKIDFTGFLTPENLKLLINQSHIFIHPSRTTPNGDREGVPNSLIEAMATGLPTISTNHGGIPEVLTNEKDAFLCNEDDVEGIYRAMVKLTSNPPLYDSIARSGSETVRKSFDLAAQNKILEACYDEAREFFREKN